MAIYLNGQKYSCNFGGQLRTIMVNLTATDKPDINGVMAVAGDGKILTTADGLYLTLKKEE